MFLVRPEKLDKRILYNILWILSNIHYMNNDYNPFVAIGKLGTSNIGLSLLPFSSQPSHWASQYYTGVRRNAVEINRVFKCL